MSTHAPESRFSSPCSTFCHSDFVIFFLSLLLLLAATLTHGADLVVSNTTQLASSVASLRPGDNLIMATGTWANADILFKAQGTPASPIYLRAQVPGKVILTGNSRLRISGHDLIVDGLVFTRGAQTDDHVIAFRESSSVLATNCRVSNCVITNFHPATAGQDTKWVSLFGASNRVDHCYFAGKTNLGTLLVVWLRDDPADVPTTT